MRLSPHRSVPIGFRRRLGQRPAGELRVLASDPLGVNSNPLVQASANVVRFMLKNNTPNTYNIPGGFLPGERLRPAKPGGRHLRAQRLV